MSERSGSVSTAFLERRLADIQRQQEQLKGGGGDGTYDGMSEVDAKIAAAEARTDTKFAQVLGRLDGIDKATSGLKATIIITAIAAIGVVFGAMAFGASQFGNGVMVTSAAVQDAAEAKRISEQNAVDLAKLREDMSKLVEAVTQKPAP